MLDEERLSILLAHAGAALEVPPSGAADILERAAEHAAPGRARRMVDAATRHRVLAIAACLLALLVLAAAVGVLSRGAAPPTRHAAPAGTHAHQGAHAPAHSGTADQRAVSAVPSPTVFAPARPIKGPAGVVGQPARMEKKGSLGLAVDPAEVRSTMTKLEALAVASGGFVARSQSRSGSGRAATPSGSITLEVPASSFATVLRRAESMGHASDVTTRATDVTQKFVNAQARVATLQASRQQYLAILSKATTVDEVLSVQEKLDAVESQIEQLQGQLSVLTKETSSSILTVRVR